MKRKIIVTDDGSHTLKVDELSEHYHSTFGALNESRHVFIEAGLQHVLRNAIEEVSILEVGFGTGLNALLTMLDKKVRDVQLIYTGLEAYPLEKDLWSALNYAEMIDEECAPEVFEKMHRYEWNTPGEIIPGFLLEKIKCKLEDYKSDKLFDLVYFDAFGPDVQPELWSEDIFHKIAGMTAVGGVLVTYSCKGSVKRALKAAGFEIEKIPGPKGKREMLRGVKG